MTLVVKLHRQSKEELDYGYLRAHVVQEGKQGGKNLLQGRHLTSIKTAKMYVTSELQHQIPGVVVEFESFEGEP